jgi:enoyl-CoA hydratase/carnithine racemase
MTTDLYIRLETGGGIAVITLNRPEKRNALNDSMREELLAALNEAAYDKSVKALVITGSGQAFCAGGDIAAMQERAGAPAGELAFNGWSRQQRTHQVVSLLHTVPKPTIAAVNGAATGLGADLALSCDFIVAGTSATFAWSYVLRGLIPDGGGMYFLPRRVGLSKAKQLIFSGKTIDAQEAFNIGVADKIVQPEALLPEAKDFAGQFTQGSATAIALGKSILNKSFELEAESVFAQGSQAQAICYTTADHQRSITAFLNKTRRER